MPYLSPSSQTTTANEQNVQVARPSHRRTRSANPTFSTESGPGAFAPLTGIPRRQRQFEKRSLFQIAPDGDEEPDNAPTASASQSKTDTVGRPQIDVSSLPPAVNAVPFPSSSEAPTESLLPFPSLYSPAVLGPSSPISRSGSTSVVLPNGKTLKPSLKSSFSSPQITDWRGQHSRSQSEASTPLFPKNVHFPERKDNLENVVLFEKTARPRAVSGNADDTETETEGYDSPANAAILPGNNNGLHFVEQQSGLEIDTDKSSPVPVIDPTTFPNVHVETLVFPRTRPPTLRGSILVRSIAFEKVVALRFTLDDWQTTSEVVCKHVCTLPSLPSPFPPERISVGSPQLTWDRFSFLIRLEDVERKLVERTILFAARFMASGVGEWWDNNGGANYKLVFRKAPPGAGPVPTKSSSSPRFGDGPKKMFPDLDLRASTMLLPPPVSNIPPLRLNAMRRDEITVSTEQRDQLLRRNIGSLGQFRTVPIKVLIPFLTVAYILAQRILSMARSSAIFSMQKVHIARQAVHLVILFNDSLHDEETLSDEQEEERLNLEGELRVFERTLKGLDTSSLDQIELEGPSTLHKIYQLFFRSRGYFKNDREEEKRSLYSKLQAYDIRALEIQRNKQQKSQFPSLRLSNYASPTSPVPVSGGGHQRSSTGMMLGLAVDAQSTSLPPPAGLDVPRARGGPTSQRRSPTSSFNSAATSGRSKSTMSTPDSSLAATSRNETPPSNDAGGSSSNSSSNPLSTTDSTYAALVEKWCFHQSSPPSKDDSPSPEMSTPVLDVPTGSMSSLSATTGFGAAAAGYGSGYGYGHYNVIGKRLPVGLKATRLLDDKSRRIQP